PCRLPPASTRDSRRMSTPPTATIICNPRQRGSTSRHRKAARISTATRATWISLRCRTTTARATSAPTSGRTCSSAERPIRSSATATSIPGKAHATTAHRTAWYPCRHIDEGRSHADASAYRCRGRAAAWKRRHDCHLSGGPRLRGLCRRQGQRRHLHLRLDPGSAQRHLHLRDHHTRHAHAYLYHATPDPQ